MFAALRHTGKRFSTLLLLIAMLLGGAVEAVACEPAVSVTVAAEVSSDLDAGSDDEAPGSQTENHGLCAHGHCHHAPQALSDASSAALLQPSSEVRSALRENILEPRMTDALKRPPRT